MSVSATWLRRVAVVAGFLVIAAVLVIFPLLAIVTTGLETWGRFISSPFTVLTIGGTVGALAVSFFAKPRGVRLSPAEIAGDLATWLRRVAVAGSLAITGTLVSLAAFGILEPGHVDDLVLAGLPSTEWWESAALLILVPLIVVGVLTAAAMVGWLVIRPNENGLRVVASWSYDAGKRRPLRCGTRCSGRGRHRAINRGSP